MSCKIVKGKDFVGFQCNNIGDYSYMEDGIMDPDNPNNDPYSRFECDHRDNYTDRSGYMVCKDCGAKYNENTLEWGE